MRYENPVGACFCTPPAVVPHARLVESVGHKSRRTRNRCARRWEREDHDPAIFLALRRFADVSLTEPLAASSKTTAISCGLAIDAGGADGGGGRARDAEKCGPSRATESELRGVRGRGLPGGGCRRSDFQRWSAAVGGRAGLIRGACSGHILAGGHARREIGHVAIAQAQHPIIFLPWLRVQDKAFPPRFRAHVTIRVFSRFRERGLLR